MVKLCAAIDEELEDLCITRDLNVYNVLVSRVTLVIFLCGCCSTDMLGKVAHLTDNKVFLLNERLDDIFVSIDDLDRYQLLTFFRLFSCGS